MIVYNGHQLCHQADALKADSPNSISSANLIEAAIVHRSFNISSATALNLFGKPEIKPTEIDATTLPDTTANLKLVGLFTSSRSGASRSLIAEQGNPAKAYVEGDTLPGNVTLFRIESDWVIVQRGDQFEKLPLHGAPSGTEKKPLRSLADMVQAQRKIIVEPPPAISPNNADKSAGPQAIYRALDASLAALQKKKS